MNDLPTHGLLQQLHSRPVSGEHLELLGQKAAQAWGCGEYSTLSDAVVATVKQAHLSPEQVKRVVEFTNHAAFSSEFRKEAQTHRIVEFAGGPADPSAILQDLNDGGGGSLYDAGNLSDYNSEPSEKKASEEEDQAFWGQFKTAGFEIPELNPLAPALDLREKLAASQEHFTAQISGLETLFAELTEQIYHQVKQAALNGNNLGEVLRVLEAAGPEEVHIKTAFASITPRLVDDGVFDSYLSVGNSLEKTGAARVVNPDHPLVTLFHEYCGVFNKYAELYGAREEVTEGLTQIEGFLLKAAYELEKRAKGVWQHLTEGADTASKMTGGAAKAIGQVAVGSESKVPEYAGDAVALATKYAPHAAAGVAAARGAQIVNRKRQSPGVQNVLSQIPGTRENRQQEDYEMARQQGLV